MKRRELEDMNCCQQMCSFIFSDQFEHLTTKHIIRIRIIIIREQRDARPGTDSTNTSEISQSDLKTNEGTENAVRSRWDCGVRTSSSAFRFWDILKFTDTFQRFPLKLWSWCHEIKIRWSGFKLLDRLWCSDQGTTSFYLPVDACRELFLGILGH